MKKRLFSLVLVATMATSLLVGCGDKKDTKPTNTTETKVEETATPTVIQGTIGGDETTKEEVNEETKAEETNVDENVSYLSGKIIDKDYVVYGKVVIKTVGDESTTYVALNEIDNPIYYSFKSSILLAGTPYIEKEYNTVQNAFGDYSIRACVLPENLFTDELPLKEWTKEYYYDGDPIPEKSNVDFIYEDGQTILIADRKYDERDGYWVAIELDNENIIYTFEIYGDVPDIMYETAKSIRLVTDASLIEEINSIEITE